MNYCFKYVHLKEKTGKDQSPIREDKVARWRDISGSVHKAPQHIPSVLPWEVQWIHIHPKKLLCLPVCPVMLQTSKFQCDSRICTWRVLCVLFEWTPVCPLCPVANFCLTKEVVRRRQLLQVSRPGDSCSRTGWSPLSWDQTGHYEEKWYLGKCLPILNIVPVLSLTCPSLRVLSYPVNWVLVRFSQ